MLCLIYYRDFKNGIVSVTIPESFSERADVFRPSFLNDKFCDHHKRRLFTKAPNLYPQFEKYGTSEINFYFVDNKLLKYKNGKLVNE